jgi:hypothetical protein
MTDLSVRPSQLADPAEAAVEAADATDVASDR